MKAYQQREKSGFTLTEVMIAAFIMAVSTAGSLGLMSWITQATGFNGHYSQASALVQDKLEELMADNEDAQTGSDSVSFYSRSWTVSSMGSGSAKKLEVAVSWPNPGTRDAFKTTTISIISPDTSSASNVGLKQPYAAPPVPIGSGI